MLAKLLFITDMHKRWRDTDSVHGIIAAQEHIQQDIIDYVKADGITHVIIGGDWYDRGFHGLAQALGAIEMDRRLSAAVNGNVFLCIGNHFYLERDDNPEMYIIQPNPAIKPVTTIPYPDVPVFNCAGELIIGQVQISFFHYDKVNKDYRSPRQPDIKFRIGVYHDSVVVPTSICEQNMMYGQGSGNAVLTRIFGDVDLGLMGHIHTPHGLVQLGQRGVPCYFPGSFSVTHNSPRDKHMYVDTPVLTINDDSTVSVSTQRFSTHMEMLKFYETHKKEEITKLPTELQSIAPTKTVGTMRQFFAQKGYTPQHFKVLDLAVNGALDLPAVIKAITEEEKVE